MHAVVVSVTVNDGETATRTLREQLVPGVSQAPGFVAGYWVRLEGGDQGRSTVGHLRVRRRCPLVGGPDERPGTQKG